MSRADELRCVAFSGISPCCTEMQAAAIIRDLEARIDGLEATLLEARALKAQMDAAIEQTRANLECEVGKLIEDARAEVPEWCRDILVLLAKAARWKGYQARKKRSELVRELVAELTTDQLRACGIDVA